MCVCLVIRLVALDLDMCGFFCWNRPKWLRPTPCMHTRSPLSSSSQRHLCLVSHTRSMTRTYVRCSLSLSSADISPEELESNWDEVTDNFDNMNLKEDLLRGIYAYGFEKPSAIQQRAITPLAKGFDVIAQAQSGTGKVSTTRACSSSLCSLPPFVRSLSLSLCLFGGFMLSALTLTASRCRRCVTIDCHVCYWHLAAD